MPTFRRLRGFRFYVYAQEGSEPPHVHIDKGSGTMKVWLADLLVASNERLKPAEIRAALQLAHQYHIFLMETWNAFEKRQS